MRKSEGGEMRQVLIRTAVKGVFTLLGILLISTALQLMIWFRGIDPLIQMVGVQMTEEYPGQNEEYRRHAIDCFREAMGLDRPFVPDLWPFDNESLWSRPDPAYR